MTRNQTPRETLSLDACKAIYAQIAQLDGVIARQQGIINNANVQIADAAKILADMDVARKSLSDQLDKFAPEDFMLPQAVTYGEGAMAPAPATSAPSPYASITPFPPAPPSPPSPPPYGHRPWHRASVALRAMPQQAYPSKPEQHLEYSF